MSTIALAILMGQAAIAPAIADGIDFADFSTNSGIPEPAIGVERTVSAGEPIALLVYGLVSPGAILTEAHADYPPGSVMIRTSSSKPFKACFRAPSPSHDHHCMIDDDDDGTFDRVAGNWIGGAKKLPTKMPYQRVEKIRVPILSPGTTRTILYQGMAGDGLKLSYREFTQADYARPAFTEEITIPLTKDFPQRFAVKGLKFTVNKIDGLGMAYTLDSLNPAQGWPEP